MTSNNGSKWEYFEESPCFDLKYSAPSPYACLILGSKSLNLPWELQGTVAPAPHWGHSSDSWHDASESSGGRGSSKILKYCTKAWKFLASQIKESKILPVQLKLQFTFGYWLVNDSGPPTNLVMSIRFIRLSQHRGSMLWLNRFLHDLMDMKRWSCPICIHCSQTQKAGSCGLSFPNPKFTKSVYNYSILLVIPAFLDLHRTVIPWHAPGMSSIRHPCAFMLTNLLTNTSGHFLGSSPFQFVKSPSIPS